MTDCYDCGDVLQDDEAFECKHCGEDYCTECLKDHKCSGKA